MDKHTHQFLADASSVQLSKSELESCKEVLLALIARDTSLDSAMQEFFAAAKSENIPMDQKRKQSNILASGSEKLQLSAYEKNEGKLALFEYIRENSTYKKQSIFTIFSSLISSKFVSITTVIALLFSATGSAAYAAEDTVPGDILYPVKVEFNEPIMERFQWGHKRKAGFAAKRMNRRIDELEKIITSGESIPSNVLDSITMRMQQSHNRLEKHLELLDEVDDVEELRMNMEQRLQRSADFLADAEDGVVDPARLEGLLQEIKSKEQHHRKHRRPPPPKEIRDAIKQNPELREKFHELRKDSRKDNMKLQNPAFNRRQMRKNRANQ